MLHDIIQGRLYKETSIVWTNVRVNVGTVNTIWEITISCGTAKTCYLSECIYIVAYTYFCHTFDTSQTVDCIAINVAYNVQT